MHPFFSFLASQLRYARAVLHLQKMQRRIEDLELQDITHRKIWNPLQKCDIWHLILLAEWIVHNWFSFWSSKLSLNFKVNVFQIPNRKYNPLKLILRSRGKVCFSKRFNLCRRKTFQGNLININANVLRYFSWLRDI